MSTEIMNGIIGQYKRAAGMFDKFIEICPDNIWAQPSGKFPVWQTVYHAVACVPFFLKGAGEQESIAYPYGREVLTFQDLTKTPMDKAKLAAFAKEINAWADKYFASINDAMLAKKHEGFSSRVGFESTLAGVLTGLSGHHMYHFGMCDAALRANGKEGLF